MKRVFIFLGIIGFVRCQAQQKIDTFITYYPDKKIKALTEMHNGKKNGKEILFQNNGKIFMIQYFKNGMPVDSFFQYDNGKLLLKGYCIMKSHIVVVDATDNKIVAENDYLENSINDGFVKLYNNRDRVASIGEYKVGKKNGISILYFLNGNIKRITHYQDGVEIPPTINFDSTGKIINNVIK